MNRTNLNKALAIPNYRPGLRNPAARWRALGPWLLALILVPAVGTAQEAAPTAPAPTPIFYVQEYRVLGATKLPPLQVEEAVYPYLGPGISPELVEQARAALEGAYRAAGYQTVTVEIPEQNPTSGIINLQVVEGKVGRLRVNGARWFLPSQIRKLAPSMAEGQVPNFNDVQRDVLAMNKMADRRVTPSLRPGADPGTYDIDLNVQDVFPLHGNVELNNRYSVDTTELRLSGGITYTNLWQLGHTAGFSFQVAPERPEDAQVYSAYYLAGIPSIDWLSILLQGTKQDSDVSTLGGVAVAGRGEIGGIRAVVALPNKPNFYHALNFGIDYKHFEENVVIGTDFSQLPITYYPLSVNYTASWLYEHHETQLNAGINWSIRGQGSTQQEFDNKRYNADGGYIYLRGDISHTQDLPGGLQVYGKLQGQAADRPLINSEQYSGGGLGTARGYIESTALGDSGVFGTIELRSPSFLPPGKDKENEWRVYGFVDAGRLGLHDPLPEQQSTFDFLSVGVGSVLKVKDFLNGSLDLGFPLEDPVAANAEDLLLTFRVWMEF